MHKKQSREAACPGVWKLRGLHTQPGFEVRPCFLMAAGTWRSCLTFLRSSHLCETGGCDIRLPWAYRGTIQRKGLVWCLGHQYAVNVSFLEKGTPQTEPKGAGLTHCISLWPFSYLMMKDKIISSRPKCSDSWPWEQDMVPKNNSQRGSTSLLRKKPDVLAGEEDSCRWRIASLTRYVKASCNGSWCKAVPELHNSGQIPGRMRFKMSFNDGVF